MPGFIYIKITKIFKYKKTEPIRISRNTLRPASPKKSIIVALYLRTLSPNYNISITQNTFDAL